MGGNQGKGVLSAASRAIGGFAVRHAVPVLVLLFAVSAAMSIFAARVEQDDDVIRFLPEDHPEVRRFTELGERFGGLSIAIVGIAADDGDLFTTDRLAFVRGLDERLASLDGVNATTTFTELPDIVERETEDGRTQADLIDLVGEIPAADDPTAAAFVKDVRERTMSRAHIAGSLVSNDGRATIVLCQIAADAPVKATADLIRGEARALLEQTDDRGPPGVSVHFAGAPFIGSYAAEQTRADLLRLSPWVIFAVVFVMFITSRSLSSVIIALVSVGVSIVLVMGAVELSGRSLTLVSSSLPVLLVALGSAYSIHLLAATLAVLDRTGGTDRPAAVLEALEEVGPPILAAGFTTAAGFVSFLVMDIAPMREFGLLMAVATIGIVFITLLLVPAAVTVLPMKSRQEGRAPQWALRAMTASARAAARHRVATWTALVAFGAGCVYFSLEVEAHTDINTLFEEGSEPVEAETFLQEQFGGSLFLQVELTGDVKSPMALRQLARFAAAAKTHERVTQVQSIATAVQIAASATYGEARVPPARETAAALGELVVSDPSARLLVTAEWDATLVQVQLGGFDMSAAPTVASDLSALGDELFDERVAVPRASLDDDLRQLERDAVLRHLEWILLAHGVEPVPRDTLASVFEPGAMGSIATDVEAELRYNLVDDPMVFLDDPASFEAIVDDTMAAIGNATLDEDAFYAILEPRVEAGERANPESLRDGVRFVYAAVRDLGKERVRSIRTANVLELHGAALEGRDIAHLTADIERALWGLADPVAMLPKARVAEHIEVDPAWPTVALDFQVAGYPLVYQGMNESVQRNQAGSLIVSGILVLIALGLFFRSPVMAVIAAIPAGFTLAVTFAAMGFFQIPMDVGTSMIAAIALGVGIDYAVHLLWRHGRPAPDEADEALESALGATGWGIVINALEVSAGLSLLAFGTIVPMRNFGLLTASAMIVSAVFTLLLVPVLARRYRTGAPAKQS